jgi:transcriptional regulator with XRE-family HTH domain
VEGLKKMSLLSDRLKQARKRKSKDGPVAITQVMVSQATGIHEKTLGGYENGVSEPDAETLKILANYYDVSTDWLLGNTNNPNGNLSDEQRDAVQKVDLDDDSFLELPFFANGRELTREEKIKLRSMAALLLDKDR